MTMKHNKYRMITPLELLDHLCNHSANGYRESFLIQLEQKWNLILPASLRQFLLEAGRERVCAGMKSIFSPDSFRKQGNYFIVGQAAGKRRIGVSLDRVSETNPPLYVENSEEEWDFFAESIDAWLMVELDRRIRKAKRSECIEYSMEQYFCCTNLLCKEWISVIEPSEHGNFFEENREWSSEEDDDLEDMDDEEENDGEYPREIVKNKEEVVSCLLAESVSLPDVWYSVAFCMDEETGILYSARFSQKEQRLVSLLQINDKKTECPDDPVLAMAPWYVEKLMRGLAEGVHNPVLAHCLTKESALPKAVRSLADKELHIWLINTIDNFLKLFEKNKSWKLGVYISDTFIECYHLGKRARGESMEDLWFGRHLMADPPAWSPAFTRVEKGEEAPKDLEPFLKEFIYRVHNYNLLNRYAFLARKIVTPGGFSKLTENYTEEERFAFLSFYRDIADGVIECIFHCLEHKVFAVRVGGKDFLELCENPAAYMGGWMRQYSSESLDFLERGHWQK